MAMFGVLIFLLAISIPKIWCDVYCLYGWQWVENLNKCVIICQHNNLTNANCNINSLLEIIVNGNASTDELFMDGGRSLTHNITTSPTCFFVTLNKEEWKYMNNKNIMFTNYFMQIFNYNISSNGAEVSFCYPLSPQLLQCDYRVSSPGEYYLENNFQLLVKSTNKTAYLGDFYIENENAITCSKTITQDISRVNYYTIPRCNYITMHSSEYQLNGNGSLFLPESRISIKNPYYSIKTYGFTQVCIPIAIDFLNCPYPLQKLPSISYILNFDQTVSAFFLCEVIPPDYYYVMDDSIIVCKSSDSKKSPGVKIFYAINYMYLVSGASLFATLVFRRDMFSTNIHTKCMLYHVVCLIAMDLLEFSRGFYDTVAIVPAYLLHAALYFFDMAMFLWLNVIAYDAWKCFSKLPNNLRISTSLKNYDAFCNHFSYLCFTPQRDLLFYSAYVWGIASLLTCIMLSFAIIPTLCSAVGLSCSSPAGYCWFKSNKAFLLFYGAPYCTMTLISLIFSTLTVVAIHKMSKGTDLVNRKRKQQMFQVSAKLFCITSFCWILDFICYTIGRQAWVIIIAWYLSIGITSVQGLIVSIVFCSKKDAEIIKNYLKTLCNSK